MIYKTITLVLVVFASIFSSYVQAEPLVRLISSPCDYDGKIISTTGILALPAPLIEPNVARLFLSKGDFKYGNYEQSILVSLPKEFSDKKELYHLNYVHIDGEFSCTMSNHGVVGAGGYKKIKKLMKAHKNPNYEYSVFPSGSVGITENEDALSFAKSIISTLKSDSKLETKWSRLFNRSEDGSVESNRLDWIFSEYLASEMLKSYSLCKVYQYEESINSEAVEGLVCYSIKGSCNLPLLGRAEDFPGWSDQEDNMCFEYNNINGSFGLSLEQFL